MVLAASNTGYNGEEKDAEQNVGRGGGREESVEVFRGDFDVEAEEEEEEEGGRACGEAKGTARGEEESGRGTIVDKE